MGMKKELEDWCYEVFRTTWTTRAGTKVPDDDSKLGLKNEAITLEGTVLYADMAESTKLVDSHANFFAAEVYKTFLYCAAKIIKDQDGAITAYDGDRIMAVFIGDSKNTNAVKAALKINSAVRDVVQPQLKRVYKDTDYVVSHTTGVDTSELFVAKTGVRGANDLVWVGRAANHAAKLSSLPSGYTYITKDVYDVMNKSVKFDSGGNDVWERRVWSGFNNSTIYRSLGWWTLD